MDFHLTFILNLGLGLLLGQVLWWLTRHICGALFRAHPTPLGSQYRSTVAGRDDVASWTVSYHGPYDGPGRLKRIFKELLTVKA